MANMSSASAAASPGDRPARVAPLTKVELDQVRVVGTKYLCGNQAVRFVARIFVILHAIEQRLLRGQRRVDGVEKFSTPSSRRSYGDDIATMAWGA